MFIFDKRRLENFISKNHMQKSAATEVYERLRREVASLAKLRHPALVKLIVPLEESKGTMRFVTEPLTSSLQHMIDINSSGVGTSSLNDGDLDELIIQKGLLQIAEGLDFLHSAAGLVHLDIQPASIMINVKGDWKLSGLGFVENYKESTKDYFLSKYDPRLPPFIQVNLDYSAPELILDHKLDTSNDIFSLGCLLIALFTTKPPMQTENNPNSYQQEFSAIPRALRDERIPKYIVEMIPRMVSRYPHDRLTLEQFKSSSLFDNVLIRTINFLDDFPMKLPAEQQAFLNGFSQLIGQFPKSVLQKKVLPTLLEELGKEETLVGSILGNILEVGKDMSQLGFSEKILPGIKKVKDVLGAQVAILNYIETLKSRLNGNEFSEDILPIVLNTIDNAPPEIQEAALQKIPIIISNLDFITLKNEVFPVIGSVFAKTTSLAVKLESLNAFEQLVSHGLDKHAVTEKLLPLLNGMKTREPKVMMGALNVYSKVISIVDIEVLAKVIVPQLLSMSMESMLNLGQFRAFMDQIKILLDRIETDHGKKLSQVQVSSDPVVKKSVAASAGGSGDSDPTVNFEDLVYGRNKKASEISSTAPVVTSNVSSPVIGSSNTGRSTNSSTMASTVVPPTSSFGSLKLEPTKKSSFAPLQPSSPHASKPSFSKNSILSSSTNNNNWAQKPSNNGVGFGATNVLSPISPSNSSFNRSLQSPSSFSAVLTPSSNNASTFQSSTITQSSNSNYNVNSNNSFNSMGTSIDWSKAMKKKEPEFGDFQQSSNAGANNSSIGGVSTRPLSPSVVPSLSSPPGWNAGNTLQPQQKYHINISSGNNSTNSFGTSGSHQESLI